MPWLTPDSIPEDDDCRPLSIPASSAWLALVSGALTELTLKYNWQKFGTLTVDETVAKMQEIVDNYYNTPCAQCTLPDGGSIIRIGSDGHVQQFTDGAWTTPSGDYVIPHPEARTDGTPPDQNCLAAKNAVNVLHSLYNDLAMAWASHLSEAEALTTFTLGAIGLVGFEFAPITAGIVAFFGAAFTALYEALAYLGADLWDDNFSNQIECFLLDCVNNDAGVVTFDWDCFMGHLNTLVDSFGLSEVQIRLYLQVTYMIYFIGGVDGLNLAARTTDITNDDCSFCGCDVCSNPVDLTATDACWTNIRGTWVIGSGLKTTFSTDPAQLNDLNVAQVEPDAGSTVTTVEFDWNAAAFGDSPLVIVQGISGGVGTELLRVGISGTSGTASISGTFTYTAYQCLLVTSQADSGVFDGYITEIRLTCL